MKIVAMYLPQYHEIPENNMWWGQGFTEWTNVKKAKPLFEGHLQPRVPLGGDYYDLSNPEKLLSQMILAKDYGLDAFAFYHYWFSGKKLLEKPLERLIEYDETPLDYCLCWANEPWTRTWDGDAGSKDILMPQEYGGENEWIEHFNYLKLFFDKKNYLKQDNRPVLIVYNPYEIAERRKMFATWDKMAQNAGFNGLYIITVLRGNLSGDKINYCDANMDFEPFETYCAMDREERGSISCTYEAENDYHYDVIDYKLFCEKLVRRRYSILRKHYYGLFAGWDNTPRRGKNTQLIFDNNSPDIFEWALRKQIQKSLELSNDYLFINAWNEWGEGTFLEPDEHYKYGYLEAVSNAGKGLL